MKATYKLIFIFTAILTVVSCTKKDADIRSSGFETPIMKGYYVRDTDGSTMAVIGSPDVKLGSESNDYSSEYFFSFFPNPCTSFCAVFIKAPTGHLPGKLWITRADFYEQTSGLATNSVNMSSLVVGGSPLVQTEFTSDYLIVDISTLEEGYYRIYLKVDEYLLYDNLVVYKPNK